MNIITAHKRKYKIISYSRKLKFRKFHITIMFSRFYYNRAEKFVESVGI